MKNNENINYIKLMNESYALIQFNNLFPGLLGFPVLRMYPSVDHLSLSYLFSPPPSKSFMFFLRALNSPTPSWCNSSPNLRALSFKWSWRWFDLWINYQSCHQPAWIILAHRKGRSNLPSLVAMGANVFYLIQKYKFW